MEPGHLCPIRLLRLGHDDAGPRLPALRRAPRPCRDRARPRRELGVARAADRGGSGEGPTRSAWTSATRATSSSPTTTATASPAPSSRPRVAVRLEHVAGIRFRNVHVNAESGFATCDAIGCATYPARQQVPVRERDRGRDARPAGARARVRRARRAGATPPPRRGAAQPGDRQGGPARRRLLVDLRRRRRAGRQALVRRAPVPSHPRLERRRWPDAGARRQRRPGQPGRRPGRRRDGAVAPRARRDGVQLQARRAGDADDGDRADDRHTAAPRPRSRSRPTTGTTASSRISTTRRPIASRRWPRCSPATRPRQARDYVSPDGSVVLPAYRTFQQGPRWLALVAGDADLRLHPGQAGIARLREQRIGDHDLQRPARRRRRDHRPEAVRQPRRRKRRGRRRTDASTSPTARCSSTRRTARSSAASTSRSGRCSSCSAARTGARCSSSRTTRSTRRGRDPRPREPAQRRSAINRSMSAASIGTDPDMFS